MHEQPSTPDDDTGCDTGCDPEAPAEPPSEPEAGTDDAEPGRGRRDPYQPL